MKFLSKNSKRKSKVIQRKLKISKKGIKKKIFQKGGSQSEIIFSAIEQISNNESLDKSLNQLNENYLSMTAYQMNLLLSKLKNLNLMENAIIPRNIQNNIQIYSRTTDIWAFDEFSSLYSEFPLVKINTNMYNMEFYGKNIKFNHNIYNYYSSGGFGKVYINVNLKEAIKIIDYSQENKKEIISLVNDEIINYFNISQLSCNNDYFCKFIDIYIKPKSHYIFVRMEYCGRDLYDVIENNKTFSLEKILVWFINISKGIKCMHDNNYVHLDIKPQNITIFEQTAKLIDFGLSYQIIQGENKILTRGTRFYIPPEIEKGIINTDYKKCDIYSLGRTIAETLFYRYFSKIKVKFTINKCLHLIGLFEMIDENPKTRPSIDQVLNILQTKLDSLTSLERNTDYNFTITQLKESDFTFNEILYIYSLSKLMKIYSLEELKKGGVSLTYFLSQNIPISLLKNDAKFSIDNFLDVYGKYGNLFSLKDLYNAGFTIENMVEKDINLNYLIQDGITVREIRESGQFDIKDFIDFFYNGSGVSLQILAKQGFTIKEVYQAGISLYNLQFIFSIEELESCGIFELKDFLNNNYKIRDLINNGIKVEKLIEAGVKLSDFYRAGIYVWEIAGPGKFELSDFLKTPIYSLRDLSKKFTIQQLKDADFTLNDFLSNGFQFSELKGLFDIKEFLKNENYSLTKLGKVFTINELKNAGITLQQFLENYYSINELKLSQCFELNDFFQIIISYDGKKEYKLINNLKFIDLINGGFKIEELKALGVSAEALKGDVSVLDLFKSGYSYGEIRDIYKEYKNTILSSTRSNRSELEKLKELQKILNKCKDWKGKRKIDCTFSH